MKITGPGPTQRVTPTRRSKADHATAADRATASRDVTDTASIMGIPAEEMTPKVREAIMTLMAEVDRMRQEMELTHRRLSELEQLADQDTLLPMANRRAFVREVTRMISYCDRYGVDCSLVYLDLNDLKKINDDYGHAAGDAALQHMAVQMQRNLRDSDIIGRLGGDEFGIILPRANEQDGHAKAVQLADAISHTPLEWQGQSIPLSVAFGSHVLGGGTNADQALAEADRKMYAHKQNIKKTAD
ncbi:MAG: GGDEF domain-containing protein [Kordiimonas sp.]|nr:GGDEF domain-containing protein [Kordiimonas sp.]